MNICSGLIICLLLGIYYGTSSAKTTQDMVLIPAGEFMMGSKDGDKDEAPVHRVHLDTFYIDKYEVTNTQYRKFIKATGHRKPYTGEDDSFSQADQPGNHPVVGVSWGDAYSYCKWVDKRLPTEAQWERAARGDKGWMFPWGEDWNSQNANSSLSDKNKPVPVGSYPQGVSPYGVHDMAGNVWEWCADWYRENYYLVSPTHNPTGPTSGEARVIRGGGWFDFGSQLRATNRFYSHPMVRYNSIGFRCARQARAQPAS